MSGSLGVSFFQRELETRAEKIAFDLLCPRAAIIPESKLCLFTAPPTQVARMKKRGQAHMTSTILGFIFPPPLSRWVRFCSYKFGVIPLSPSIRTSYKGDYKERAAWGHMGTFTSPRGIDSNNAAPPSSVYSHRVWTFWGGFLVTLGSVAKKLTEIYTTANDLDTWQHRERHSLVPLLLLSCQTRQMPVTHVKLFQTPEYSWHFCLSLQSSTMSYWWGWAKFKILIFKHRCQPKKIFFWDNIKSSLKVRTLPK